MNWRGITDRIIKTCRDTFGEGMQYIPAVGSPIQIKGIFDNGYLAADPDTQAIITISQPILGVVLADLPIAPKKGDKVKIQEVTYKIVDSQEDGWGHAQLMLQKL